MLWRIWRTDNGRWSVGVISCRQSLFRFVSVSLFFSRVSIDSRHILFLRLASYRLRWVRLNGIFYGSFPSFWKYCKLNLNLCTSFSWHRKLLYSYTKRTGIFCCCCSVPAHDMLATRAYSFGDFGGAIRLLCAFSCAGQPGHAHFCCLLCDGKNDNINFDRVFGNENGISCASIERKNEFRRVCLCVVSVVVRLETRVVQCVRHEQTNELCAWVVQLCCIRNKTEILNYALQF